MEQLNYHQLTDRFLEKDFKYENEIYTVTLTIESENIKSMTGYSEKEIVSILKEHPYRINLAMRSMYDEKALKDLLLKLSNLDYEIVTGKTDKFFGFEMFLLDL